jgi:hypothetical protein
MAFKLVPNWLLIGLIMVFGLWLRWYLMPGALFFGPEQGKDFLTIRDIAYRGELTLLGSKTDFDGVFHGPAYYYLISLPLRLASGNPVVIAFLLILIQSITIIFVYKLGKNIANKRVALLSAILFSLSYGLVVWSRWLSAQPLVIPLTVIFLWAIVKFIQGHKRFLILAAIAAGLMGQVEFIQYLILPVFIILLLIRFWPKFRQAGLTWLILCLAVGLVVGWGNFLIFDLRHHWLIIQSLIRALHYGHGSALSLFEAWSQVWLVYTAWVAQYLGFMPTELTRLLIFVVFGFLSWRFLKGDRYQEILLWWLTAPLIVLTFFGRGALDQLFVMIGPAIIITLALILETIWTHWGKWWAITLTLILCLISLNQLRLNLPHNKQVFFQASQPNVKFVDQLAVIDYIYHQAGNRTFGYESFTVPYFWRDGWDYLFWFRSHNLYQDKLPTGPNSNLIYVIVQKDGGDPNLRDMWVSDINRDTGQLISKKQFGVFEVMEFIPK